MKPEIAPFFQIAIGRSGTTAAMRLAVAHPQIGAHPDYPLELRAFAHALHPDDASLRAGLDHHRELAPFTAADLADLDRGRALSVAQVRALYRRLAERQQKPDARFAAEKYPPRLDIEAAMTAAPDARALLLVRDPRDVIASARAFDAKRRYRGFVERDGDTDEELVARYAGLYRRLDELRRTLPGSLLVRYEDMVAHPKAFAGAMFDWLGVAADADIVAGVVAQAAAVKPGRHLTAASVPESVGRWREAISPRLADLVTTQMDQELAAFGYGP